MKELFESLKHVDNVDGYVFLDTCFIFDLLDRGLDLKNGYNYAVSSFTVEELLKVGRHKDKIQLRKLLKSFPFVVVNIDVHIGDWVSEKKFVNSIDKDLLKYVADPSDAVLMAVAIKNNSIVLTKDKHHLFTVMLENFLKKYNLKVLKEIKDL